MSAASDLVSSTTLGDGGPRLLLLHGLFGQGKNWTTVAKDLAGDARVTLVDLPDHGRSRWSDTFSYATMADRVADLVEQLTGQPEDGPVAVAGHSMGGKVAMTLALRRPDLVERLVVVDISPVRYAQLSGFAGYVAGMRSIDLTTLADRGTADRQLEPYVTDPVIRSFLLQNLRRGPGPDSAGERWHWQMNLRLLGDHLPDLGDWSATGATPYAGPLLWLAGARSDYVRPEYAPAMRALFPRAQLMTVKNAGHWLHADQPGVFVAAVRRFLHLPPSLTVNPG